MSPYTNLADAPDAPQTSPDGNGEALVILSINALLIALIAYWLVTKVGLDK